VALGLYGGLALQNGRFVNAKGNEVKLTPMQQQLMEILWLSPTRQLSKTEICNALWPKKEDANETLYTLIRRLKPIIEEHSDLKIESDRGKSYGLTMR
jgi:DNA-binding response OmpR family regulator